MYRFQSPMAQLDQDAAAAWHHNPWIAFNRNLDLAAADLPNEARIEGWLKTLAGIEVADLRVYWLTLARITELTLKQAGDYADHAEFQAAGDLLANPRAVDVYRRGWHAPVRKDRHLALSDQFAAAIGDEHPAAWLARETVSHVREAALLPHLKQLLESSGFMAPAYLADLERRMAKVSDTVGFLASWQVADPAGLLWRMETARPADRQLLTERLCRFDLGVFSAMGADIDHIVLHFTDRGRFLIPLKMTRVG